MGELVGPGAGRPVAGDRETRLFAYEMLLLRQQTQANLLWQTPALALTAQAFLLTIALVADFSATGRVLAAGLGVVVAVISMQTMARHRYLESLDSFQMEALEHELGLPPISSRDWRSQAPVPGGRFATPVGSGATGLSSYRVWQLGLATFAVVNLAVVVIELVRPALFG